MNGWRKPHDVDDDAFVIEGRPDFGNHRFGEVEASRFPPCVYSTRNGALMHRVIRVSVRWWRPDYDRLVRLRRPRMTAHTACGMMFFLTPDRAMTCEIPAADAVRCGRCHGAGATFPRTAPQTAARRHAHAKLACHAGEPS